MKILLVLASLAAQASPLAPNPDWSNDVVITAQCSIGGGTATGGTETVCEAFVPVGIVEGDFDVHNMVRCALIRAPLAAKASQSAYGDLVLRSGQATLIKIVMRTATVNLPDRDERQPVTYILPPQDKAAVSSCDSYTIKLRNWVTGSSFQGIVASVAD